LTEASSDRLVLTTPSDLEIVMTRVFNAPRDLLFDAWTRPEHLKRWLGREGDEMIICEVDLRAGGTWRYVWRLREGTEMGMHGEYREVVRPERIVSIEVFEGADFETMGGVTLNTLVFEEKDGRTTVISTSLYKSREDRDGALATGMEAGAAESMDRLVDLLAMLRTSN
jgi:uncharacterized protein YndB with AHSA1/START domain